MVSPEDYPEDQRAKLDEGDANRGHRPGKGSGPVTGSGAGAGGKGNPEDFDADPQGGGGQAPIPVDRGPKEGERTSVAQGKRVSVRVDLGGRRLIKKKQNEEHQP